MSHLPIGQVQSNTPNWPATRITQAVAHQTQRVTLATYAANVDVTSVGPKFIFTTDPDKGRFVPLHIANYCTAGNLPGGFGLTISVGWNPANTQPYIDWVNQESIQDITTGGFGAGNYQIPQEIPIQANYDYPRVSTPIPVWYEGGQYVASAPPSTNVYVNVVQRDGASIDRRTFVITGFYTGA